MSEEVKFSGFVPYKQTVTQITLDLNKLREFSQKMGLEKNALAIDDVLKRLKDDVFNVAIVGEFKRGKSTLINALLGSDVLPTDVLPATAALNKITYGISPLVRIEYKNGKSEEIGIDQLNNFVTKLTKESEERAKTIKEAVVYFPIKYCKNDVTIIDTPGLNDNEAMTEVTLSVLPQIDAAVVVVMAQSPFSDSERDFLESKIITSDLGRVMFVVTGIDLIRKKEDADRVLENIANRIQEKVVAKAKNTYGSDSKEFEIYNRKIGKVKVYGLSGIMALEAKMEGDNDKLEKSYFPAFETALERFLTEQKGAISLSVPLNRIKTSAVELAKAVQLRESALTMEKDEYDKKYEQAMEKIDKIKDERKREMMKVNEAAQKAYTKVLPDINNYWQSLETAAGNAIDSVEVKTLDEIKKPALQATLEKLLEKAVNALTRESQSIMERIQTAIEIAVENEAERISGFEESFFRVTSEIEGLFTNKDLTAVNTKNDSGTIVGVIMNAASGFGIGGIYMGFKQAGWKGALLGGATGVAGMFAGDLVLLGLLLPLLAIPVTWPVVLVGGLVTGLLGTFASKKVLDKAFQTDKIENFKKSFKENILKELAKMKAKDNISDSVKGQVNIVFEALKNKVTTESDNILTDLQNQLTQFKMKRAQTSASGEKENEELRQMIKTIDEICDRANDIGKQLALVLSR